ncbi:MAG: hypothetical protein NZ899_05860 [Thermoguttaceae bacterium]|nr:hypothetical protein [Thermoguttaceae bacterium]MDW8079466.1 hypothetical protein [Thermoguttaceae bacterium]
MPALIATIGCIVIALSGVEDLAATAGQASASERGQAGLIPIFNGDFETAGKGNPPPGWAMWGPNKDKVPEHFAQDTREARSGKASLRIFHPKNSRGYIVTDPQHAIQPQEGQTLRVSFWAKADRPRKARFGITAYQSIRPFVDAPAPGFHAIDVTPEWRKYEFAFDEGLDFFADQSRYLLLTFMGTDAPEEEGTLWVDDITVTAEPGKHPRLLNPATIPIEPLRHHLVPGDHLEVTVEVGRPAGKTTLPISGISFHRVAGWTAQPFSRSGEYRLLPVQEEAIRELRLPMTRFYGVGDEPFSVEEALDRIAFICRRLEIPEEWTVIELEDQSAARKIAPEAWAKAVAYARGKGYRFRFWEVANEPYSGLWGQGGAYATAADYIAHFRQVSQAIKAVDKSAQVGIAIHPHNVRWGNLVLKEAAGHYDFVVGHYYAFPRIFQMPFEEVAVTENMRVLEHILRMNALIKAYNPGREVYQLDTEWGLHASGRDGERADYVDRNANIWGVVHRAIRMIYYAREGMLRGASGWQMLSMSRGQGFGILFTDVPEARSMLYWLYFYFNRHLGPDLLAIEGQGPYWTPPRPAEKSLAAPLTPVLATRSGDRSTLFLVIVNASWSQSYPARINLRGGQALRATGVILSSADVDAKPLLREKGDFVQAFQMTLQGDSLQGKLPPHSVAFLTVDLAKQ